MNEVREAVIRMTHQEMLNIIERALQLEYMDKREIDHIESIRTGFLVYVSVPVKDVPKVP